MRPLTAAVLGALLLLVLATCDKPTPVAPADSGLTISVNPTRIEVDGEATVTVIARKADGSAVNEGTEVNFSTNLGRIDPEIAKTNDRGIATATLSGDGRVGTATVTASSGAAAAVTVEVQIGGRPSSLTLEANPGRIPREGGTVTLVAQVLDDLGNRLRGIAISFDTDAGTLDSGGSAVDTDSRGEARDTLTLTSFDVAGVDDGIFVVTATTVGAGGSPLTAEDEVEIGGFAQTIILTPNPRTVSASGGEVELSALVLDDGGDPLPGVGVIFSTAAGVLESRGRPQPTDADGIASDILAVTSNDLAVVSGTFFNVRARAPGAGGELISDEQPISIAETRTLTLVASPSTVSTAAPALVTLTATFEDAGEGIEDAVVTFTILSGSGTLSATEASTDSQGVATVTLSPTPGSSAAIQVRAVTRVGSKEFPATATISKTVP